MTPRSVAEWQGRSPDSRIPPRVRLRVLEHANYLCAGCGFPLYGKKWECDHVKALINGGKNRESNLEARCQSCHRIKSAFDVAEKSRTAKQRAAHNGIKRRTSRPLPGTYASGWKNFFSGGWERR